jgi:hypothetical protein
MVPTTHKPSFVIFWITIAFPAGKFNAIEEIRNKKQKQAIEPRGI